MPDLLASVGENINSKADNNYLGYKVTKLKEFIIQGQMLNIFFLPLYFTHFCNKLECFALASLSSQV